MVSKQSDEPGGSGERPIPKSAGDETSGDDSAFDRLLEEAAKVSSPGRLLAPGTKLSNGRFVIRRRVGEGGMGVVFEAIDNQTDTRVAIKTLSRVDAAGIYRMKGEFRSLSGVAHPNLVPLHELFADGDLWFFTMDLVGGVHFDSHVRPASSFALANTVTSQSANKSSVPDGPRPIEERPIEEGALRAALYQLVTGVRAIHAAGKLHRDLKPSNVLVTPGGQVVILDFGLTSAASAPGATQTVEHGVAGTPAYMAPEQARGEPATEASDWYAIGVMLFEVFSGRLPFEGKPLEILMAKQGRGAPTLAGRANPANGAAEDLAALCDHLLARDPGSRPGAAEILTALGAEGGHEPLRDRIAAGGHTRRSATPMPIEPQRAPRATTTPDEPFVGRGREMAQLETALADTNEGKPVLVLVDGPSGIGKTAFVDHFLTAIRARGDAVILSGRCYQREFVPYKAFDGVVDALSRFLIRLSHSEAARLVPRHAQALARVFPVLGRVPAIAAAPQRRGLPSDAVELRYQAFEALKQLLAVMAEERPLILSIDDLQWSDRDSARLLKHLWAPPDPPMLLLVATHRDDELQAEGLVAFREALATDGAGPELNARRITLDGLSASESLRLAQQLAPDHSRQAAERIVRGAGGSPFLLGELATSVRSNNGPCDLQRVILDRVEALAQSERDVLQAICVAPRPVAHELLSAVVERGSVRASLRTLTLARLGREVAGRAKATSEEQFVTAYHDRIREAVRDAMPTEQRAQWHGRFATQLKKAAALDFDALVEHALGSGHPVAAGEYALQAARHAATALAFDRAAELFETALAHAPLVATIRAGVLVELAVALSAAGRCANAAAAFLRAAEVEPSRGAECRRCAGEQFFLSGRVREGSEVLRPDFAAARLDYDGLLAEHPLEAYQALITRGFVFDAHPAESIAPAVLGLLDTLWAAALGTAYVLTTPTVAIAYLRQALAVGEPWRVVRGRALLFVQFEAPVDRDGATKRLPELLAPLQQADSPQALAWAALCQGAHSYWRGDADLGASKLGRAEQRLSANECAGMARELSICRLLLASGSSLRGPSRLARERGLRYLSIADDTGNRMLATRLRTNGSLNFLQGEGLARIRAEVRRGMDSAAELTKAFATGEGLLALTVLDAYEGKFDDVLARTGDFVSRLGGGGSWPGLWYRFTRSVILLAASFASHEREALLERVERDVAVLSRPLSAFGTSVQYPLLAGCAEYIQGQLAAARGDRQSALESIDQAVGLAVPETALAWFFRAGAARLGSGPDSAEMKQVLADMRAAGFVDPERELTLFAPNLED